MDHMFPDATAARIILRMLHKEITADDAVRQVVALNKKRARSRQNGCSPGANGVCLTHGQVLTDCQKDR